MISHGLSLVLPLQSGDDCLLNLASSYASDLGAPYQEVLQQLEDLRLAEWSDRAPLTAPPQPGQQQQQPMRRSGALPPTPNTNEVRNYVNCPTVVSSAAAEEPIYVPGQYQV